MKINTSKALKHILLCGIFSIPCLTAQAETNFRCGNYVIGAGNTMNEIVARCGEPAQRRDYYKSPVYHDYYGYRYLHEQEVTEWVYNYGPDKFMVQLRFLNGELQDVETLGYGY
ncbi:DUF2845 domain-containing protein [Chitinibacter sp. S2-10]|uniref:DUF2845 domain-containing protein n=1 Tax=Chitinibacter sp. S2-10 TaxID=3373597 RepID=UPI0039774845